MVSRRTTGGSWRRHLPAVRPSKACPRYGGSAVPARVDNGISEQSVTGAGARRRGKGDHALTSGDALSSGRGLRTRADDPARCVMPAVERQPGFVVMGNREELEIVGINLWNTKADVLSSEEGEYLQERIGEVLLPSKRPLTFEGFEVGAIS